MPELFQAMEKSASSQSSDSKYGRQGVFDYQNPGYIPNSYHESVNHTLDSAYSDFCLHKVAKCLNKNVEAEKYGKRALNYINLFDPKTGFMRSKDSNGNFKQPFNNYSWGGDYAEGSAWQSSFAVFQYFAGLINLYGGNDKFQSKIIELCNQEPRFDVSGYGFEIHEMSEMAAIDFGQVAISNQPSFHLPYLFSYIGKPEMAQPLIKQLLTQAFNSSKYGYPAMRIMVVCQLGTFLIVQVSIL